uniref:ZMYM2-like/QRICH1 C-terminal domain-containing protein n=1 Tax=Helobdella robusta TaxID=6412 RepID=T1EI54_HELRO
MWESRYLGSHSPYSLIDTLVYLNTKNFLLTTVDAHLGLSFSNVMKQWKKNAVSTDGKPARTVYLKYNPITVEKKSKIDPNLPYEQLENIENPLRCPVKLYEFYLSKCPESIKHRNDLFYLLPEPSCVPESPVWFSTTSIDPNDLAIMINRVKIVREVQESLMMLNS